MKDSELFARHTAKLRSLTWFGFSLALLLLLVNLRVDVLAHAYRDAVYSIPLCILLALLLAIARHQNWARRLWIVLFMPLVFLILLLFKIAWVYPTVLYFVYKDKGALILFQSIAGPSLLVFGMVLTAYLLTSQYRALFARIPSNKGRRILLWVFAACALGFGLFVSTSLKVSVDAATKRIWLDDPDRIFSPIFHLINKKPSVPLVRVDAPMDYQWPLTTVDGRPVRVADFQGKVLFINIWATWCAPCIAELDSIERLAQDFKDQKDLAFLIVSEEDPDVVQNFLRRYPHQLPIYIAPQGRPHVLISPAYPVSFIVSNAGRVVAAREGPLAWDTKATIRFFETLVRDTSHAAPAKALEKLPLGALPNMSPRLLLRPYYPPEVNQLERKASALSQDRKYAQAAIMARQYLSIVEKDSDTMTTAEALKFLGILNANQGRLGEAEKLASRALTIAESCMGTSSSEIIPYLDCLGKTYIGESKAKAAYWLYQRAINLAQQDPRQKSALPALLRNLATDERRLNLFEDAQLCEQKARQEESELQSGSAH